MCTFCIQLANQTIKINTLYNETRSFFKEFLTKGEPSFDISVTQAEIDYERLENRTNQDISCWDNPSVEILVLLRIIASKLVDYQVFLLHGAAISVNHCGYIFCGISGVGKSTHVFKWLNKLPDAVEINGDKPFIVTKGRPLVCGSPWGGKERIFRNDQVPLKSIVLIERAEENHIERISLSQAYPVLCQMVFRPDETEKTIKTLHMLKSLEPYVSFWHFQLNNFKDNCFDVAYNALVKNLS